MSRRDIATVDGLVAAGLVKATNAPHLHAVAERYAIGVTADLAQLIDREDPNDPIALQFVPQAAELLQTDDERADPIGDHAHSPVKGIVHRYPDRVLLKAVHICPVYCRFCFRREMVGPDGDGTLTAAEIETALAYIAAHEEIWEVILTGGDPLMLSPRRLSAIMLSLAAIPHVRIVRLHSRVPIADPERIDLAVIDALRKAGKPVYVAIHANHPRELTTPVEAACRRMLEAGFELLSQTVLLKGVNDEVEILAQLMRRFVELRIRPYYLHHPDLAPGTGHFRLSIEEGQALVAGLRGRISGLCQPTYVLDIPGGFGKTMVARSGHGKAPDGSAQVTDYRDGTHRYPPEAASS